MNIRSTFILNVNGDHQGWRLRLRTRRMCGSEGNAPALASASLPTQVLRDIVPFSQASRRCAPTHLAACARPFQPRHTHLNRRHRSLLRRPCGWSEESQRLLDSSRPPLGHKQQRLYAAPAKTGPATVCGIDFIFMGFWALPAHRATCTLANVAIAVTRHLVGTSSLVCQPSPSRRLYY